MIAQTYPLWVAWAPTNVTPDSVTPDEMTADILSEQSARVVGWTTPEDRGTGDSRTGRFMVASQAICSRPMIVTQGKGYAHEFRADDGFQVFYSDSLHGAVALAVGYAYSH